MRSFLLSVLFIILSIDLFAQCPGITGRQQDSCQLIVLRDSLSKNTTWLNPWNVSNQMSTWNGVRLNANGRVRSLTLTNRRVNGILPPDFALPELDTLIISFSSKNANCVREKLPDFANFPNLKFLNLSNNCFNDTLPTALPAGLEHVNLSGSNSLYGSVKHYNLPQLKVLNLARNAFYEIKSNFAYPLLEMLYLESNLLPGSFPNINAGQLKILNISNNQLTGNIPLFDTVPNLEELYLNLNAFSGTLPNFDLSNLRILNVESNQLNGVVPHLATPALEQLRLTDNLFVDPLPNFDLPNLQSLYCGTNPYLTGSSPVFDNLPSLRYASITGNNLRGPLPLFSNSHSLQELYMNNNKLNDTIPNYSFPALKMLHLHNNDSIRGNLKNYNMPELLEFRADYNAITGGFPAFNNMPKLRILNLLSNALSMELPEGIVLPSLRVLNISHNSLRGPLSLTFTDGLDSLEQLILNANLLTGEIPDFSSPTLFHVALGYNRFTGTLPPFLNALKLKRIYASHNYLAGNIPDYKAQAGRDTSQMYVDITNNYFSYGDIAASSYNTIDNYAYRGQIIPLYYNPEENKLSVQAGHVSSPSENTYLWSKICGSNTETLPETGSELLLPAVPDGCRYRCVISNSVIEKNDPVRTTPTSPPGALKKLMIGSYLFTYSEPESSCIYLNDTLYCDNVLGNIRQNIIYTGDSLFAKGVTPLHFRYPEALLWKERFQPSSGTIGTLAFDTTGFNQSEVILPDYVAEYTPVPGKRKKILGDIDYSIRHQILDAGSNLGFESIGMDDLCVSCEKIEADFLYFRAIVTDSTNIYNYHTGEVVIPFQYTDYVHNTAAPSFKIYYSIDGTSSLSSFVEVGANDIRLIDGIFFVKFILPASAVSISTLIKNFENFKYKIEASSQSGRNFSIVSDYFLYYTRDVTISGYAGMQEDRFDIIENLKNPSCEMYWYVLYDNTKLRTGNNYPANLRINDKVLFNGFGTESPVDDSHRLYTATIQRGSFKVDRLPSCYKIEAIHNTSVKTFRMDYKLVCVERNSVRP